MGVREQMRIISEADGRFDRMAPAEVRRAVENARRAGLKAPEVLEKQGKESGLEKPIRAKYKIEVTFSTGRTTAGPNLVGIQIWESGRRLHGGGDDLAFFCDRHEKENAPPGCGGVITSDFVRGGETVCPHCQKAWKGERPNIRVGRPSTRNLAIYIAKLFRELGSNADIYLKFHKTDIRYIAMERAKGPEVARRLKGMHIYALKNIIKDTSSGADLVGRFMAFLTS